MDRQQTVFVSEAERSEYHERVRRLPRLVGLGWIESATHYMARIAGTVEGQRYWCGQKDCQPCAIQPEGERTVGEDDNS